MVTMQQQCDTIQIALAASDGNVLSYVMANIGQTWRSLLSDLSSASWARQVPPAADCMESLYMWQCGGCGNAPIATSGLSSFSLKRC